jgi:hypothetical protein
MPTMVRGKCAPKRVDATQPGRPAGAFCASDHTYFPATANPFIAQSNMSSISTSSLFSSALCHYERTKASKLASKAAPLPRKEIIVDELLRSAFDSLRAGAGAEDAAAPADPCSRVYLRVSVAPQGGGAPSAGGFKPLKFLVPLAHGGLMYKFISSADPRGEIASILEPASKSVHSKRLLSVGDDKKAMRYVKWGENSGALPDWSAANGQRYFVFSARLAVCPHCAGEVVARTGGSGDLIASRSARNICAKSASGGEADLMESMLVNIGGSTAVRVIKLASKFDYKKFARSSNYSKFLADPLIEFRSFGIVVDASGLGAAKTSPKAMFVKEIDLAHTDNFVRAYVLQYAIKEVEFVKIGIRSAIGRGGVSTQSLILAEARDILYEESINYRSDPETSYRACDLLSKARALIDLDTTIKVSNAEAVSCAALMSEFSERIKKVSNHIESIVVEKENELVATAAMLHAALQKCYRSRYEAGGGQAIAKRNDAESCGEQEARGVEADDASDQSDESSSESESEESESEESETSLESDLSLSDSDAQSDDECLSEEQEETDQSSSSDEEDDSDESSSYEESDESEVVVAAEPPRRRPSHAAAAPAQPPREQGGAQSRKKRPLAGVSALDIARAIVLKKAKRHGGH